MEAQPPSLPCSEEHRRPRAKESVLLHKGGPELQEVFASLDSASASEFDSATDGSLSTEDAEAKAAKEAATGKKADKPDVFLVAIAKLNAHFKPSLNKFYERHVFRQLRQGDESLDQFVVKLQRQAPHCSFADVDEAIVDQIIEGTSNPEFRRKILEQRLEKLSQIIELGKLLEAVKVQSSAMGESLSLSQPPDSVARMGAAGSVVAGQNQAQP